MGHSPDLLQFFSVFPKCSVRTLFLSTPFRRLIRSQSVLLHPIQLGQQDNGAIDFASEVDETLERRSSGQTFISHILCDSSGRSQACLRSVRVIFAHTGTLLVMLQGHISHGLLQASATTSVFQLQNLRAGRRPLFTAEPLSKTSCKSC